jgi:hypothetical protein
MNTYLSPPALPTEPTPAPTPSPERSDPKHKPFLKSALCALGLALAATTFAQTTPPQDNPTGQQPNNNTLPNQGWTMFNQDVGMRLQLEGDQLQRLQNVDAQYADRYRALGNDPWLNDRYPALSNERNASIQQILTPEQFTNWSKENDRNSGIPSNTRNAPTSTPVPVQP